MSELTEDKIELSQQQTRVWILVGLAGFLLVLVQGAFTYFVSSSSIEMRETNRNLVGVTAAIQVVQTQMTYMQRQIDELQVSKKEAGQVHQAHDTRLNSIEQRLALHDQWISAHNQ